MPSFKDIIQEIQRANPHDVVRRKYLGKYHEKTGRNVIVYYSGWLLAAGERARDLGAAFSINDNDKNGFMATVHGLDRSKGLDLFLHTPGGSVGATESIIRYLRNIFATDIRVVVPQIAMSAGTMIACSATSIVMGRQSSLGPTDPQIGGIPAHGIVAEFEQALREVRQDPATIPLWQAMVAKYTPSLIGSCQRAIKWADELCLEMLESGMFAGDDDPKAKAQAVIDTLGSHEETKAHDRHLHADRCAKIGLVVERLEGDQDLQDIVLSIHHATLATMQAAQSIKFMENQDGAVFHQQAT